MKYSILVLARDTVCLNNSAFEDANNVSVKYKFASRRDGDVEKYSAILTK